DSVYSAWWYRELTDNSPVMIWASGLDKGYKFFNRAWIDFSGKPLESLLGNGWSEDVHPDDLEFCLESHYAAFDEGKCFDIEYRLRRHDGEYRWVIDTAAPRFNDKGEFQGFIGSCIDITPRMNRELRLGLVAKSVDLMDDGVMMTGADRKISWVNPAFTKITGYALDEIKGKKPSILSSGKHNTEFYTNMYEKLDAGERWQGEIWNRRKDGDIYPEWLSVNVVKDESGRLINYVGIFSDITKQKANEEQSRYLSTHDPLTGLGNRHLLEQTLEFAILNSKRSRKGVAVLFIDLDGFKWINDTYGHMVGDDLLRDVACTLSEAIRESDIATRPGGDEFILILENLTCIDDAMKAAKKIAKPVHLKIDPSAFVTFSIGISYYDGVGKTDAKTLIDQADQAMYQVKQSGKNAIRIAI
ncbi:MAG: diguanylate cyclase, partial [Nitrosomonadales bacterium]|nr:diguanylate cyclase [Nitrosomonadales bacterium]